MSAGGSGGEAASSGTGGRGGALPGAGGEDTAGGALAGAGGGGSPDARPADPMTGGAGGQAVPVVNRCTVIPSISSHCGYLNARYDAIDRQLNGIRCRICTVDDGGKISNITGCSPQPGGGICVADCSACCYDVSNSVCDSDRDCCAPLRCVPVGSGTVKACR